jgi:quinol---cytochrome c reductase iron-sulfur subunit, bacillus type
MAPSASACGTWYVVDTHERGTVQSNEELELSSHGDQTPHLPPPSLWPIGFAVGIACILAGLVISWPAVAVGAVIAAIFGFLWIRDVTTGVRGPVPEVEPEIRSVRESGAPPAAAGEAALPAMSDEEIAAYPRSTFLSAATLGLGGVIGGLITVPVLGFAVLPSFTNQKRQNVELGPLEDFPEGEFVIATYLEDPAIGEVTRRTVFARNNGLLEGKPSFTILFSRCVHLGCPVQPNGPVFDDRKKTVGEHKVELTPVQPAGFGCPCHGGQYDTEGNRTAGPPVRAMDRAAFSIKDGKLWLGEFYSVGKVEGQGARARIKKYGHTNPGVHVDGPEAWLYPIEVPG